MTATVTALLLLAWILQPPAPPGQPPPSPAAAADGVDRLVWLAGCWTMPRAKGLTEEHWMPPAGGTMLGMSRTISDGRTVEHEFIRIAPVNGVLSYVAQPSGQREATFALVSLTDDAVVFENAAHDFPQRISYRRTGDTSLTARIEGTVDGQPRSRDFPYRRCGG